MRLPTTVVASVLDGLSDADARRRDANLAAAPPPRRRRRSPAVFRFVLATLRRACERPADGLLFDSFSSRSRRRVSFRWLGGGRRGEGEEGGEGNGVNEPVRILRTIFIRLFRGIPVERVSLWLNR